MADAEPHTLASLIHDMAEHVHRRFDAIETGFQAEMAYLRDRQGAIATALHHILQRDTAMSELTDAIRAEIASVSGDVDALIAQKKADDTAALSGIKSDMDALKAKVAAALLSGAVPSSVSEHAADLGATDPVIPAESPVSEIPTA